MAPPRASLATMPPEPPTAELPLRMVSMSAIVPPWLSMPPPTAGPEAPDALSATPTAALFVMAESSTVSVPVFSMPPPAAR